MYRAIYFTDKVSRFRVQGSMPPPESIFTQAVPLAASVQSEHRRNLGQLISHSAHRVLREQSKRLCVLSELCEIFKCSFIRGFRVTFLA
jgi:hypothetical protein